MLVLCWSFVPFGALRNTMIISEILMVQKRRRGCRQRLRNSYQPFKIIICCRTVESTLKLVSL